MLSVLFQDEFLVAVHKPPGLLVHRTRIAEDKDVILQRLRDQLGQYVHTVHRLDRGTSGVLLFAFDPDTTRKVREMFDRQEVRKTYWAIVRGWITETGSLDYPLKKELTGPEQDAVTDWRRLATAELPVPVDRYETARYSFVEINPRTGRWHQIRRHFAHLRHPVIGDKKHGDRHHNRVWDERLGMIGMYLLARKVEFNHPVTGEPLKIVAEPGLNFKTALGIFEDPPKLAILAAGF